MNDRVEGNIRIFIGNLDAAGEHAVRRAFLAVNGIDDLNNVIVAESELIANFLQVVVGCIVRLRTGGIDRPVAPRARICGRSCVIVIPRERVRVGRRRVRTVVATIAGTTDKACQQTRTISVAVVADTVHQHPAVRSDDHGHTADVAAAGDGERGFAHIELAQRNAEVGIVIKISTRGHAVFIQLMLYGAVKADSHALTKKACRCGKDFGLLAALLDRTEGREKLEIAVGGIHRRAGMEACDADLLRTTFFQRDIRHHCAAEFARRAAADRLAEAVLDAERERIRKHNAFAAVIFARADQRHGDGIGTDRLPIDCGEIILQLQIAYVIGDRAGLALNAVANSEFAHRLFNCRKAACFVLNLRFRQGNGRIVRLELCTDYLICRLLRRVIRIRDTGIFGIIGTRSFLRGSACEQAQRHQDRK